LRLAQPSLNFTGVGYATSAENDATLPMSPYRGG
jgi:hypothetical protein